MFHPRFARQGLSVANATPTPFSLSGAQSRPDRVSQSHSPGHLPGHLPSHVQSRGRRPAGWDPERFAALARARWPAATPYYVSRATGVPEATVAKHLRDAAKPGADHVMRYLASELGPELINAFCGGWNDWPDKGQAGG